MNAPTRRWVLVGLAVLDLLFFGGWVGGEVLHRRGTQVHLPVDGYDPRDLLSGHYVRFTLRAREEARAVEPGADAYCLKEGADGLSHVSGVKALKSSCWPFLTALRGSDRTPDFGVDRFFIDERSALTEHPIARGDNAYLVATVDSNGRLHTVDLVVAGQSVRAEKR